MVRHLPKSSALLAGLLLAACSGSDDDCLLYDMYGACTAHEARTTEYRFSLQSGNSLPHGIRIPIAVVSDPPSGKRLRCYASEHYPFLEVDQDCRGVTSRRLGRASIRVEQDGGSAGSIPIETFPEARWANPSGDAASVASSITMVRGLGAISWGSNAAGLLGNSVPDPAAMALLPVQVGNASFPSLPARQVALGGERAAAIDLLGGVWVWGLAAQGSGTDLTGTLYGPTRVRRSAADGTFIGAVQVAASSDSVAVVMEDGSLLGWGLHSGAAVTPQVVPYPAPVLSEAGTPLTGMRTVRAGWQAMGAIGEDGRVWVWGFKAGPNGEDQPTARILRAADGTELTSIVSLAFGAGHLLAVTADGRLYAAGENDAGQLGQGAASEPLRGAVLVLDASGGPLANVAMAAASADVSLALLTDGRVLAWGSATTASIGCGQPRCGNASDLQLLPRPVVSPSGSAELSDIVSIQGSDAAVYAMAADGSVYAWGTAGPGLGLGVPVSTDLYVPTPMAGEGSGSLKLRPHEFPNLLGAMR